MCIYCKITFPIS